MVINYCRREDFDPKMIIFLIKTVLYYPGKVRAILNALNQDELIALVESSSLARPQPYEPSLSVDTILNNIPLGTIPFSCWSRHLYFATDYENKHHQRGFHYYNLLLNGIKDNSGGYQGLVWSLLKYHNKRSDISEEHYTFFGYEVGYSRTQKLAAVHKILIHVYGTEAEKRAAGPFTKLEKRIIDQGKLGSATSNYAGQMRQLMMAAEMPELASPSLMSNSIGS